jgi:hypothetical protein
MKTRQYLLIIITLCILPFLCSCTILPWTKLPPDPYGIWESNDPEITLELCGIHRAVGRLGIGVYVKNDEPIDIVVKRDHWDGLSFMDAEFPNYYSDLTRFFFGEFALQDDKLYINLTSAFQERTGFTQLVFERIGDCCSDCEVDE